MSATGISKEIETAGQLEELRQEVRIAAEELLSAANMKPGQILVVGCSSSEIASHKIGSYSSAEIGKAVFEELYAVTKSQGLYLAAQCCEHLNRALIVEEEAAIIRRVFELTNQRYSKMEICKLFNEEGVLTPLQSMSRRQKSDSKKAASRGLQWTSDMIRKIVDDKTYIGCMVYGKTKIPDPGTGKEVPVPRNQWKVMENHHEPIVSKEVFEKAQSLQIRYTKKSKFDRETTLLGGYVKCGNCRRSLTSSSPVHGHILYSCAYSKGKEDTGCFAGKADNKMLEHIVLAEIKAYLRQNISQEQMQQSMRKQHEDSIEAYKTESADCEKCQEQIKIQNRQNYEKYHEGQMNQNQFMEAKKQLEEERERLQKRVQELDELINDEKEILMKKNVPVEQMLKYLGYENLTREMLEEYVQGIYVYDDGRVEVEWG